MWEPRPTGYSEGRDDGADFFWELEPPSSLLASDVWWRRRLAAAVEGSAPLDYTVLSVGVLTLALLLVVELIRHRLDVSAKDRPFFHEVLEVFYRELATLGIVEFCLWILHQYWKGMPLEQEAVFAKVHFLLFYTAILNAIQSIFLAVFSNQVSTRLWVNTEELELNHYIAIREEFDRVEAVLMGDDKDSPERDDSDDHRRRRDRLAEDLFSARQIWRNVRRRLRHPALMRKYDELLVQVRFHELRVHFIRANDLPLKFKVSDYLKKSELEVLIHLVHISSFAWLMLMGMVNLVYFLMSMVALGFRDSNVGSAEAVGIALKIIFVAGCCVSVLLSIAIVQRMKRVFSQIMHMKLIDKNGQDTGTTSVDSDNDSISIPRPTVAPIPSSRPTVAQISTGAKGVNQLDLFWGGDPSYITGSIQLMQFGFSIFAAALLIFWDEINAVVEGQVRGIAMALILVVSWVIFVYIMARVIPRYTLCTSLGQLVNVQELRECLAQYRLDEALRKRRKLMEAKKIEDDTRGMLSNVTSKDDDDHGGKKPVINMTGRNAPTALPKPTFERRYSEDSDTEAVRRQQLADLVLKPTKDLPKLPPTSSSRPPRRRRRRAASDGVAAMRMMASESALAAGTALGLTNSLRDSGTSDGAEGGVEQGAASEIKSEDKKDRPSPTHEEEISNERSGRKPRRRRLTKSVSENVALMRSPRSSLFAEKSVETGETDGNASGLPASKPGHQRAATSGFFATPADNDSAARELVASSTKKTAPKSSAPPLKPVLEGIPAHSCSGATLAVPLGREDEKGVQKPPPRMNGHASTSATMSRLTRSPAPAPAPARVAPPAPVPIPVPAPARPASSGFSSDEDLPQNASDKDDDHSDADDIPVPRHVTEKDEVSHYTVIDFRDKLREFLITKRYRSLSTVCGTMVCFFMVGMRMETLLLTSGIVQDSPSTIDFPPKVSFWWEVTWLMMFIVVSGVTVVMFWPRPSKPGVARMCIAGISDVILCSACLTLLFLSQWQRENNGMGHFCSEEYESCKKSAVCYQEYNECKKDDCNCVGIIEPFTSLIILREVRFGWGKRMNSCWMKLKQTLKTRRKHRETSSMVLSKRALSIFSKMSEPSEGTSGRSMTHEKGTIIELWRTAISLHADIVDEHGEFSSELLQAMLGIPIVESKPKTTENNEANDSRPSSPETAISKPQFAYNRAISDISNVTLDQSVKINAYDLHRVHSSLQLESCYSELSPDVQAVIFAGRVGQPMKCVVRRTSEDDFFTSDDEFFGGNPRSPKMPKSPGSPNLVKFAFDDEQNAVEEEEEKGGNMSILLEPNARLLRSMRRCERRLPPMLDKWATVDVVLTKYELVYFETDGDDGSSTRATSRDVAINMVDSMDSDAKKQDTVREAMVATKGGKKLRLRDVAIGRRIVGHVDLATVDMLKVERYLPMYTDDSEDIVGVDDEDSSNGTVVVTGEYWRSNIQENFSAQTSVRHTQASIERRWERVTEDRLRIHSTQGILFLRFFSDLADAESKVASKGRTITKGSVRKDDALLWCQTIGRLCGKEQLRQKLPHFGDLGSDELADYLEVIHRGNDEMTANSPRGNWGVLRRKHRRTNTMPTLPSETARRQSMPSLSEKKLQDKSLPTSSKQRELSPQHRSGRSFTDGMTISSEDVVDVLDLASSIENMTATSSKAVASNEDVTLVPPVRPPLFDESGGMESKTENASHPSSQHNETVDEVEPKTKEVRFTLDHETLPEASSGSNREVQVEPMSNEPPQSPKEASASSIVSVSALGGANSEPDIGSGGNIDLRDGASKGEKSNNAESGVDTNGGLLP